MSDSDSDTQDMPDYGDMSMGEPQPEEHLWLGTLSEENNVIKFEGCDDSESNLILKRATLDGDCEDTDRHVVQIISLDHGDKRISGTLCALGLKSGNCSVSLDSLVVSPPTAFKLLKGKGPLTLSGNLMKEPEPGMMPGDEDSDEGLDDIVGRVNGDVGSSDEESVEADGPIIEEMKDGSSSEEEEKENKKPKSSPNKTASGPIKAEKKNAKKRKDTSVVKGEESPSSGKKAKIESVKAKIDANKDKPARDPITNAKQLIEAIQSSKGGRPQKRGKFNNWVKNQFKVENNDWADKAWKAVNEAK